MNGYTVVSGSSLRTLSPPNPPPTTPSSSTFSTSFSAASCVTINNASCWVPLITRNGSGKRRGLLPAFSTGRRGLKCGCGRAPDLLPLECNWEEDYKDHEFIVVNFYHFVSIEDPDDEVAKHLAFLQVENQYPSYFSQFCFLECFSVNLLCIMLYALNSNALGKFNAALITHRQLHEHHQP